MADMTYKVDIDIGQATNNLKKLQDNVDKLTNKFSAFSAVIAGLGLGAIITNMTKYADAIQDVSDATSISSRAIIAFSSAMVDNGSDAEGARNSLLKFTQTIDDAASGSKEAQKAFAKVGISLVDLQKLSEEELFTKAMQGLSGIENASQRMGLQVALFGKASRSANMSQVASSYTAAFTESQRYATAQKSIADAVGKLDSVMTQFTNKLMVATKPMADFINQLTPDQINKITDGMVTLTGVVTGVGVAFSGLKYVAPVLSQLLNLVGISAIITGASAAAVTAAKTFQIFGSVLMNYTIPAWAQSIKQAGLFNAIISETPKTVGMLAKRLSYVGQAFAELLGPIASVIAKLGTWLIIASAVVVSIKAFYDAAKLYDNAADIIENGSARAVEGLGNLAREVLNLPTDLIGKLLGISNPIGLGDIFNAPLAQAKAVREEAEKAQKAMKDSWKPVGTEKGRKAPSQQDLDLLAGKKSEREVLSANADALTRMTQELLNQTQAYKDRNSVMLSSIDQETALLSMNEDQAEVIRAQTQIFSDMSAKIADLTTKKAMLKDDEQAMIPVINAQIDAIRKNADETAAAIAIKIQAQQSAKKMIDIEKAAVEASIKAWDDYAARQMTLGQQILDIRKKMNDVMFAGQTATMGPTDKAIAEINKQSQEATLAAQQVFASGFEDNGDGLTPERMAELSAGLAQIKAGYDAIAQEQIKNLTASQTWEAGWKTAMNNYVDDATNAANVAKQSFDVMAGGMNSAIDTFVETGKFSFKDFASSIIKDLLKIQLKMAAMNLLKAAGSSFGIPGFADGGSPPVGQVSVVGERGPELFVPKTAGTVIPNHTLAAMAANRGSQQSIVNNVTNITNNVSAVDGQSVARLFNDNRRHLLGATEQAKKELPMKIR